MSIHSAYLWAGGPNSDRNAAIKDISKAFEQMNLVHPSVAYIGTASEDDVSFFHYFQRFFIKAGVKESFMVPIVKNYDEEQTKKMLAAADLIFLTGGEVEDGIVYLKKHRVDEMLKDLFKAGKPFMGVSAGAIMMGQHWVHWDKEDDDSTSSLFDCLGFLPYTFDSHGEDEGWKELKCAVNLLGEGAKGYGLASGGFYVVDEEGKWTCYHQDPVVYEKKDGLVIRSK